jgi:hypothetical protein
MKSRSLIVALLALVVSGPAIAQELQPPRNDGLEQQLLTLEQQRIDSLARRQQFERDQALNPSSGLTTADQALRDLDNRREMDRLLFEGQQLRDQMAREQQLRDAALPNRRVEPFSPTVIQNPEARGLSPAPDGYFYARVDGRDVLVDAGSNLVARVLPPGPNDPVADPPPRALPQPQRPPGVGVWPTEPVALPPLGTDVTGLASSARTSPPLPSATGPSPPKQPPLPVRLVRPDSALVVRDPASLKLGDAPRGTYYSQIDGRIYLVDDRTYQVIALIRP